jgi:hypothetical protein
LQTPQRAESVKKPKIKLTTSATPKAANGATATPKSTKQAAESKSSKAKSKKKDADEKKAEKESTPKEPELSAEDKHVGKEVCWRAPTIAGRLESLTRVQKGVLFLRHKLQKGLLTKDQEPKEEEMKLMSDYVTKLEGFPDLEVSIIRATKINKVLKAILKLENIPKEDEFKFKPRSQALLDKWNKLLAVDGPEVNGTSKAPAKANGVKEKSEAAAEPVKAKEESKEKETPKEESKEASEEPKEAPKEADKSEEAVEKPAAEEVSR